MQRPGRCYLFGAAAAVALAATPASGQVGSCPMPPSAAGGTDNIHTRYVEGHLLPPVIKSGAKPFSLADRMRRLRYSANLDRHRDRWGEAMREHEAILDALRRRAPQELSDILFRHLRNKRIAAVEHFSNTAPALLCSDPPKTRALETPL